jgi:SAM-dependent methyltransferase
MPYSDLPNWRSNLKSFIPPAALSNLRKLRRRLGHTRNRFRSVEAIFTDIYKNKGWGRGDRDFCSGSGSNDTVARPYASLVMNFVRENRIQSIVDLGCGDFRVGSILRVDGVKYIGIDVVSELIALNTSKYADSAISFRRLDIIEDDLPEADLCLIRQVLQHLSNPQILAITHKLSKYKYVIVTEHYPPDGGQTTPNIDKVPGADTRLLDGSAVYLEEPPFSMGPSRLLLNLEVPDWQVRPGERLKTFLFERARGYEEQ